MKFDLKLTDTQLGLLGGTAFAVLYAFGGIPIVRLEERMSRVNIITVALVVWSMLRALCGAAATFPQLLLIRARGRSRGGRLLAARALADIRLCRAVAAHVGAVDLFLRHLARLSTSSRRRMVLQPLPIHAIGLSAHFGNFRGGEKSPDDGVTFGFEFCDQILHDP